ncbi:hypothetical protein BGZ73_000400, partial [Actinomortierella ambigua]
ERIGGGAFGEVFIAEWSGIHCAAKKLNVTVEEFRQVEIQKEISILHQLRHRNVIQFYATHAQNEDLYLIMDLAEGGDLTGAIKCRTLDWNAKPHIAHEIARGLEYIHDLGIVHSDLKSGNVLLTKHMEVKLCDFGLAQIRSVSISKSGGDHTNNTTVAMLIAHGKRETIPEMTPDKYRQVLEQCWDQDPTKRPTAREVILSDHGADDPPVVECQGSRGQSPVLHDARRDDLSAAKITTSLTSMSLLPSSNTSFQKPSGSEGFASYDVHALLGRANAGDVEAQISLAAMFEDGIGVDRDDTESFKWYLRAAEVGSVEAQFKTGCHFKDGRGRFKTDTASIESMNKR